MQESEKTLNSLSSCISRSIAARVSGCTRRNSISQMTLWPKSPQARASPPSEMNANIVSRQRSPFGGTIAPVGCGISFSLAELYYISNTYFIEMHDLSMKYLAKQSALT